MAGGWVVHATRIASSPNLACGYLFDYLAT